MTLLKVDAVQPLPHADPSRVDAARAGARAARRDHRRGPVRHGLARALRHRRQRLHARDRSASCCPARSRTWWPSSASARASAARSPCAAAARRSAARPSAPASSSTRRSISTRVLEVNVEERWARVEPGIVLDELNARLRPHGLRFAPDVSTASRATIGGMMANNSSGARSVLLRQDHRPRARAGRRALRRIGGALRAAGAGGARRAPAPATASRRGAIAPCASWRARTPTRSSAALPEGAAPRQGLQPRRVHAPAIGRSTWPSCWSGRRARSASSLAAKVNLVPLPRGQGRARDPVHGTARRARRHAAHPAARAVGRRGDGPLHPRLHAPERRARPRCATASSRATPARCCASSSTPTSRRPCRRAWRRSKRISAPTASATATSTPSTCRRRRASGGCARRRSACRWR